MDKVYKNPLTGEDLAPEKVVEIIKTYGSYDAWVEKLKKNPVTREMVNTDPKANGGNVVAREKMKEQAQARTGLGMKVADVAMDAMHYVPGLGVGADIADSIRAGGDAGGSNGLSILSAGMNEGLKDGLKELATSGDGYEQMLGGMLKSEIGLGKVVGVADDIGNTARLIKDVVKTPNKDYQSHYFGDSSGQKKDKKTTSDWGSYLK